MEQVNNFLKYDVNVFNRIENKVIASIHEASKTDILSLNDRDWSCNWQRFWEDADWDCEGIIKLTFQEKILGLIHIALYPYPYPNNQPEYLEILHIECLNKKKREVNPVGFWLIWYVTKIALSYCTGNLEGEIVVLDALEVAIDYYQNKVKMEEIGWTTTAPGEDAYAFMFKEDSAKKYCQRIESQYGVIRYFT